MTRYELIRAVTKKAGVSEIEATAFFEVFMFKLKEALKQNNTTKIEGVGYFSKRKGVSSRKEVLAGSIDEEPEVLDLIIFSDKLEDFKDTSKSHTFILPNAEPVDTPALDARFNLSINKPLISDFSKDSSDPENFKSLYGKELTRLLNNKAERLITTMKEVDIGREEAEQSIETILESSENHFTVVPTDQVENIANELTTEVNPPILDEAEIKDIKIPQTEEDKRRLESLPWDYGRKFQVKKPEEHHDEPKTEKHLHIKDDYIPLQQLYMKKPEPFRVGKPKEEEDAKKKELENEISEIIGNFQRVKPIVSDTTERQNENPEQDLTIKSSGDEIKSDAGDISSENSDFQEVKSKTESLQNKVPLVNVKREWRKEKPKRQEYDEEAKIALRRKQAQKKKSLMFIFIMMSFLVVAGIVYVYFERESIFGSDSDEQLIITQSWQNTTPQVDQQSNLIDSSIDDIIPPPPVSAAEIAALEKKKQEARMLETTRSEVRETGVRTTTTQTPTVPVAVPDEIKPQVTERPAATEKIVSKSGEYYNVIMGTFDNQDIADKEAEKYNDMGYNAVVSGTVVPGKGMRYRVRVGDFTSEENALKFKNLHSK